MDRPKDEDESDEAGDRRMDARRVRLVALEAELSTLRRELGVDGHVVVGTPLADVAAFTILERYASDFLSVHSADGRYTYASEGCKRILGWSPAELLGRSAYDFVHPEDIDAISANHERHLRENFSSITYRFRTPDGSFVWVETDASTFVGDSGNATIVCVTRDVTETIRAREAEARLVAELRERVAQIEELSGLLPICAWCKSIRDDEGYWHRVDTYLTRHGGLSFTHGICPSCSGSIELP